MGRTYTDRSSIFKVDENFKNGYVGITSETTISQHFNETEGLLLKAAKSGIVEAYGYLGDTY